MAGHRREHGEHRHRAEFMYTDNYFDDDTENALEDDHSEGQLLKDRENNYGAEGLTEAE